jgi:hypothetical protein
MLISPRSLTARRGGLGRLSLALLAALAIGFATSADADPGSQPPTGTPPPTIATPSPASATPAPDGANSITILTYAIPFTPAPANGAPLVTVRINDKIDATFLVDTGSPQTSVSEDLVAKLGLPTRPAIHPDGTPITADGKPVRYATMDSFQIGSSSLKDLLHFHPFVWQVLVQSARKLHSLAAQPLDGVIGADLLAKFAVGFDFRDHLVTFYNPGGQTRQVWQSGGLVGPAGSELPLTIPGDYWAFLVPAQFGDGNTSQQASLLLDTGSPYTIVPYSVAKALSLHDVRSGTMSGQFGSVSIDQAQVPTVGLGDLRLSGFPVAYPDKGTILTTFGLLGLDVLSGYRVLMDFPAKRMYLTPVIPLVQAKPATPPATSAPASPPVPKQP